jgi:signal peptidase II
VSARPALAHPSPRVSRGGFGAYAVALVVVALDQLSKAWVLGPLHLAERGAVPVFAFVRFSLVWNRGFSFGLLSQSSLARWGLFAFSVAVAAALAVWAARVVRAVPALGLGLIIGGALGNAVDRLRLGAVVDFIDVTRLGFFPWVFNVADSAITVGVILLLADSLLARSEPAGRR